MTRILVTGATGFIGQKLCAELENNDSSILKAGRRLSKNPNDIYFDLATSNSDLQLSNLGIRTVYHLAGKAHAHSTQENRGEEYHRLNTEGTFRLLQSCKAAGIKRFVFFSTVKVYGEQSGDLKPINETFEPTPETPYGKSKLEAEKLVLNGNFVPEPVVLRLSMVYGNGEDRGNMDRMIRAVQRGMFPPLPEVGNKRSMVHVEDVVQAAMLAANSNKAVGRIFNVTDLQYYSTRKIYNLIRFSLGLPATKFSVPSAILNAAAKCGDTLGFILKREMPLNTTTLNKLMGNAWFDGDSLQETLKYRPKWTFDKWVNSL